MVSVQQFSSWNTWNTCCEARTEEHAFIFCVFNGLLQLPFSWFLAQHGGFESTLRIACGGSRAEGSPWHRRYSKMALSCQHYSKFYLNLVEIFRCWAWSECLFELWRNFIARCLTPRFQSWEARGEDPQHQGTAATRRLRLSVTHFWCRRSQAKPRKASLMLGCGTSEGNETCMAHGNRKTKSEEVWKH